jgi:hypothetical protein
MNQGFKLRFDQMREGNPTGSADAAGPDGVSVYPSPSGRTLCLVWPEGRRFFLNYAYLVAGEFRVDGEVNLIQLEFTSHLVTIQGYGLHPLFTDLLDHLPRWIEMTDPRYRETSSTERLLVTELAVRPQDQ